MKKQLKINNKEKHYKTVGNLEQQTQTHKQKQTNENKRNHNKNTHNHTNHKNKHKTVKHNTNNSSPYKKQLNELEQTFENNKQQN